MHLISPMLVSRTGGASRLAPVSPPAAESRTRPGSLAYQASQAALISQAQSNCPAELTSRRKPDSKVASGSPAMPAGRRDSSRRAASGSHPGQGSVSSAVQAGRPSGRLNPRDRELRHRALASLVLSVLALVALLGLGGDLHRVVYLLIFSAVVGIGSCVIGITAVVKARKTGCYRPRGSVGGIVLGALAAALSIPILATYLAFPHQVESYVKCLNQSQSSGSEQSCMDKFYKSINLGALGQDGGVIVQIDARSRQG